MITNVIFFLLASVLQVVSLIFGAINVVIPDTVKNAISYFLNIGNYLRGVFPVSDLYLAVLFLFTVWIGMYGVKMLISLLSMLPFMQKFEIHHGRDMQP